MGFQIRLPEWIARIWNLRAFGMTNARMNGVGIFRRAPDPFRLVGEQGFMHAAPMGKIRNQLQLRTRSQKLHRRRRTEQRATTMRLVINFQAVPVRQRAGVIENREVFFPVSYTHLDVYKRQDTQLLK